LAKGQALVGAAIAIAVAAIVIGAVAIPILSGVNTTGWSSMNATIYQYVPTFLVLALLIGAIAAAGILRR
jgi:uncharacterized membrane protein YbhN (UPF0104 family)